MGNGKLGNDNPGSSANSTVIPLFIWNVDMQLLYIKLSAVIYATLLNCQLVAVFSVSAITQIRHYCIEPTFYQKPTPLFAVEALLSRQTQGKASIATSIMRSSYLLHSLPLPTLPTPPKNGCRIFRLPSFPLPTLPLPSLPRIIST